MRRELHPISVYCLLLCSCDCFSSSATRRYSESLVSQHLLCNSRGPCAFGLLVISLFFFLINSFFFSSTSFTTTYSKKSLKQGPKRSSKSAKVILLVKTKLFSRKTSTHWILCCREREVRNELDRLFYAQKRVAARGQREVDLCHSHAFLFNLNKFLYKNTSS